MNCIAHPVGKLARLELARGLVRGTEKRVAAMRADDLGEDERDDAGCGEKNKARHAGCRSAGVGA